MKRFRFTYFNKDVWRWTQLVIRALTKEKAIEKFKEKYNDDYDRIIELKIGK